MLERTLDSLIYQTSSSGEQVELLLVDNDPEGSASPVFQKVMAKSTMKGHYFIEPKKGIVNMRNRVLEEAIRCGGDFLAFIDDDEIAADDWLERLYEGLTGFQAEVASGFSLQKLPENTPDWMIEGQFFRLSEYPTGTLRRSASTRNILFDLKKLCVEWNLRFHPGLNMTGSSDTYFFEEAYLRGAKMVWIAEAVVSEEMPPSRLTKKWILDRAFRSGNSLVVRNYLRYGRLTTFKLLPEAFFDLITGGLLWLIYLPFGKASSVKAEKKMAMARGTISGVFGYTFYEYRKSHGY